MRRVRLLLADDHGVLRAGLRGRAALVRYALERGLLEEAEGDAPS